MIRKYFTIRRRNITAVQYIVESYEGIATVTTIDPYIAIIQIAIIPDFFQEAMKLINDIRNKYYFEEIYPG